MVDIVAVTGGVLVVGSGTFPVAMQKIRSLFIKQSIEKEQESPLGILTGHSDPPHP